MNRREFITASGGAAIAWPAASRAQQPAMPVVGFLQPGSPADSGHFAAAFLNGLRELGYVEGNNLRVEYRWAEGQRFPQFSEDLVKRRVAVIAAGGPPATLAAKSATSTIPSFLLAAMIRSRRALSRVSIGPEATSPG
jgi:putative ABC transport system substrate-binding protein